MNVSRSDAQCFARHIPHFAFDFSRDGFAVTRRFPACPRQPFNLRHKTVSDRNTGGNRPHRRCRSAPVQTAPLTTAGIKPASEQNFVINVGDRVYFGLNCSDVLGDARPVLDGQADWPKRYPKVKAIVHAPVTKAPAAKPAPVNTAGTASQTLTLKILAGLVPLITNYPDRARQNGGRYLC